MTGSDGAGRKDVGQFFDVTRHLLGSVAGLALLVTVFNLVSFWIGEIPCSAPIRISESVTFCREKGSYSAALDTPAGFVLLSWVLASVESAGRGELLAPLVAAVSLGVIPLVAGARKEVLVGELHDEHE